MICNSPGNREVGFNGVKPVHALGVLGGKNFPSAHELLGVDRGVGLTMTHKVCV